nr:uncharacterized protein LOC109186838 isoform X2 [Ipomoea batatas]
MKSNQNLESQIHSALFPTYQVDPLCRFMQVFIQLLSCVLFRIRRPCPFLALALGSNNYRLTKLYLSSSPNPYFIDVEIRDFDNAPSHSEKATSSKLTSSISNQNAEGLCISL